MKFNKMKLAALAMSALMAASTVSPAVYAADLFSDGAEEVFISEEAAVPAAEEITPDAEVVPVLKEDSNSSNTEDGKWYRIDRWEYNSEVPEESLIYYAVMDASGELGDANPYKITSYSIVAEETCLTGKIVDLCYIFPTGDSVHQQMVVTTPKGEHTWEDAGYSSVYIKHPTHTESGKVYRLQKCTVCGTIEVDYDENHAKVIGPTEHIWKETVLAATADDNVVITGEKVAVDRIPTKYSDPVTETLYKAVLDENGIPKVADPRYDAYYYEVKICEDYSTDHGVEITRKSVASYRSDRFKIVFGEDSNIWDDQADKIIQMYLTGSYNEKNIELKDCSKPGWFERVFLDGDGNELDAKDHIEVAAHHYEAQVVRFDTKQDALRCSVSGGSVSNNSCLPVAYHVVTYCAARKEEGSKCALPAKNISYVYVNGAPGNNDYRVIAEEDKTAPASDHHIIEQNLKADISRIVNIARSQNILPNYKDIKQAVDLYTSASIPEDLITATCTKEGTLTVAYDCLVCGKENVELQVIDIDKLGHDYTGYIRTNIVEPTCTSIGSWDSVDSCTRCGDIRDSKHYESKKLPHTNEIETVLTKKNLAIKFSGKVVVDDNNSKLLTWGTSQPLDKGIAGIEVPEGYSVTSNLYSYCDNCGWEMKEDENLKLYISSIKKEGKDCLAGSITLISKFMSGDKVLMTKEETFDYYSSETAYTGRTAHTWEIIREEIVKEATETAAGLKKVTSRCKVCGTEKTEDVEIPALGVKPAKPAAPSISAASAGYNSINVSWNAVENASGYRLYYRSAGTGVNRWKFIRVVNGTSFRHTGLVTGEAYRYTVKAVVNGVQSDYSKTGAVARPMPAAPVIRSVTAVSAGTKVTWSKVEGADGYIIQRRTASGSWTRIATVKSGTKVTWTDKKAVSGASYRVRAYCTANNKNYKGDFSTAK